MIATILLLDKDAEAGAAFEKALQEASPGTQLHWAKTAEEASEMLTVLQPDLLFLDINDANPCLQPYEMVMSSSVSRTIPIVMHSRSQNPTHIAWGYSYGATLFFKKPSHYGVLVMGLRKVLEGNWKHIDAPWLYQTPSLKTAKVA